VLAFVSEKQLEAAFFSVWKPPVRSTQPLKRPAFVCVIAVSAVDHAGNFIAIRERPTPVPSTACAIRPGSNTRSWARHCHCFSFFRVVPDTHGLDDRQQLHLNT
jgi:hypothetical protein